MELTEEQNGVMIKVLKFIDDYKNDQAIVIQGNAGTGKSFLLSVLVDKIKGETKVLTLTGKATDVLKRKGVNSNTIHSFVYKVMKVKGVMKFVFAHNYVDVIIIDESSMLSKDLLRDILASCRKLVLIGDEFQLPPIKSCENIFTKYKTLNLTKIHRQAKGNPIIRLAHMVRNGRKINNTGTSKSETGKIIVKKFNGTFYIYEGIDVVVCGRNNTKNFINEAYRKHLGIKDIKPTTGEKMMILNNKKDRGLFNGQTVTITRVGENYNIGENEVFDLDVIDYEGTSLGTITTYYRTFKEKLFKKTEVEFNDKGMSQSEAKGYSKAMVYLDFCYAITCHKSQGSEFENVLLLVYDNFMWGEEGRRWEYTGITRASRNLIVEY